MFIVSRFLLIFCIDRYSDFPVPECVFFKLQESLLTYLVGKQYNLIFA